jgi:RNA polymerase sigma-70 factor (ECF subfamily)
MEQSVELSDEEVVARVRAGELALYEILMRRHNQKLYRAVRAILHNEGEVRAWSKRPTSRPFAT